jgi:type IV pilus assembly protein PilV
MLGTVQTAQASRRSAGFTIVELLVAFVVLSIGMLGIAGLFAVTLRSSGNAIQRVLAVDLASDIADRIRANRRAGNAYAADAAATDDKCVGESSVTCSADEMARNDVWLWRQQIAQAFPGGTARGTIGSRAGSSSVAPSTYTIQIAWNERARNSSERYEPQEYRLEIQAPIY